MQTQSSPAQGPKLQPLPSKKPSIKNESYYQKQAELGKVMDLEEIGLKGRLEGFCPFYYERHSRAVANVVLVPYNYLFDRKVWTGEEGVRLEGAILVLD
jgi:Rad3-related DNA helicase